MPSTTAEFNARAAEVRGAIEKHSGKMPLTGGTDLKPKILQDLSAGILEFRALRIGNDAQAPLDISFSDYVKDKWGFAPDNRGNHDSFFRAIDLNPSFHSISSMSSMGDYNDTYRWLIPEIITDSIRLGLRKPAIYTSLITGDETVSQPEITLPYINMSDAMPYRANEGESTREGSLSFAQRTVRLQKVKMKLNVTDEVMRYVKLNVLGIFLEDVGVKMNTALDAMAILTLLNGDNSGVGNAAPVVGVKSTTNGLTYEDLLHVWLRMGELGRTPEPIIAGEDMAIKTLMIPEFNSLFSLLPGIDNKQVNLRTPLPTRNDLYVHGAMPTANQIMIVDTNAALMKLTAQPLMIENDRDIDKGLTDTVISMVTGYAKMYTDAAVVIDQSLLFSTNGFPTWMDAMSVMNQQFR